MLKPSGRPLAAWIGCKPIEITWLPFVSNYQFDLVLNDNNPYQLSRQPFVIYTYDGELMIRDSGGYHGATVNSQRIGIDRTTNMVRYVLARIAASSAQPIHNIASRF